MSNGCNESGVKPACRCARNKNACAVEGQPTLSGCELSGGTRSGALDLIFDQTEQGRTLRILTLIDEYTKQALAIHVGYSIRAVDAITVLEAAVERYGAPQNIRSDNGPEFIAKAIQDWLGQTNIQTAYIRPGSPWEQAYIESFHDKLRDECLHREILPTLAEARVILEGWRVEYNQQRPHSALGYLTPEEFSKRQTTTGCDRQNAALKFGDAVGFDERSGFMRDLSPIALIRPGRLAPTSRTRTGHSRKAPVRGD